MGYGILRYMRLYINRSTFSPFIRTKNGMRALLFWVLLVGETGSAFSQQIVIHGIVKDKETRGGLDKVNIALNGKVIGTTFKGNYSFQVPLSSFTLKFTHVGYNAVSRQIRSDQLIGDSLKLDIWMTSAVIDLDTFTVSADQKPETVIGNNSFFVQDFEFTDGPVYKRDNDLLLLTSDRKTDAWSIKLATEDQKIISNFDIPVMDVLRLYKDFLGYINVICKEEIYRVKISADDLVLQQLPKQDYEWMIMPCVDSINTSIYFSNYRNDYPEFSYFAYNKNDSTKVLVRSVIDKDLALQYSFEYEFLKPKEKLYARKIEQQTGIDKHEVAAYMTDYAHQRWFTPLYAPMFIIRDTVLIFDHYSDKIYKYDSKNNPLDSVPISYHHPEKWREWKRELIKDDRSDLIYGLFLKGGFTYLKEINTYSGDIESISKLYFQFVEKVKIKNGSAYYIYRPFSSLQTKFLYREKLSSSR